MIAAKCTSCGIEIFTKTCPRKFCLECRILKRKEAVKRCADKKADKDIH